MNKRTVFHIIVWCLIGTSFFGCIYGALHVDDGCIRHHCIYNQTQDGNCIFSVPNTTYSCVFKSQLCPPGDPICYTTEDNYCPYLDCGNSIYEGVLITSIFVLLLTVFIYILAYIFGFFNLSHNYQSINK